MAASVVVRTDVRYNFISPCWQFSISDSKTFLELERFMERVSLPGAFKKQSDSF